MEHKPSSSSGISVSESSSSETSSSSSFPKNAWKSIKLVDNGSAICCFTKKELFHENVQNSLNFSLTCFKFSFFITPF